jgi:methylaspartate mutase sigma subunit
MNARVIIGLIGHDIHVVANRVLHEALHDRGFMVYNLRTNNTMDDFVDAVTETEAQAILMSSLNGEAENWCRNARAHLADAGFGDILLYIGGNIVVGERNKEQVEALFRNYGFDRVFYGAVDFNHVLDLLEKDLRYGRTAAK